MSATESRPLDGVRILDCSTFIAGPFATSLLGEFGAEVIKVESPDGGDPFRRYGTPTKRPDATLAFLSEARNKKSVTLNLKDPRGAELFRNLASKSDVLCENFRPGTLEGWGLGYDQLAELNPGLVMLRVSGYGQTGPYRELPGFARIAHAFGGLTHLTGEPGGTPMTPGSTSLGDYMTGLFGAVGVLVALRQKEKSGRGQVVDIGLYESVLRVLDELAPAYAMSGKVRQPEGAGTINACPHGHFACADGSWIALACTSDKMFGRLATAMKQPELARPDLYGDVAARLTDRGTVNALVSGWTQAQERAEVLKICRAHGVPCGPINDIADIFEDPHIAARGNLARVVDRLAGPVVVPATVPRLTETPGQIDTLGASLGEHTDEVLGDLLDLWSEETSTLRQRGVI